MVSSHIQKKILKIPVAHGEGRYFADEQTLDGILKNKQILFQYCDENGQVSENANPNGATYDIAGICNKNRNVFGMMPHPERACSEVLGNTDGREILKALTFDLQGSKCRSTNYFFTERDQLIMFFKIQKSPKGHLIYLFKNNDEIIGT